MSLLPPAGYVSTAIAALYSIAKVLHKETNMDYRSGSNNYLSNSRGVYIRFGQSENITELSSAGIHLTSQNEFEQDPFKVDGIMLRFRPTHSINDTEIVSAICSIDAYMAPPYKGSTYKKKLSDNTILQGLNKKILHNDDFDLVIPNIEMSVVNYLRQAMASGRIKSFILEETGEFTQIPDHFWRTEKSDKCFLYEHPVSININGQVTIGHVFLELDELCSAWDNAWKNFEKNSTFAGNVFQTRPSPYIEYMLSASTHFGLIEGRQSDGSRLMKDEIERWLDANWPAGLGEKTPTLIKNMATLIRHPSAARGGNVKASPSATDLNLPGNQRSREIKQITRMI